MTAKKKKLHIDALVAQAHAALTEAFKFRDEYDELRKELWKHGYHQVVELGGFLGYLVTDGGGNIEVADPDFLLTHLDEPIQMDAKAAELFAHLEGKEEPSRRRKTVSYNRARLGKRHNWTCCYCAEQGTESVGPDGRQWHVDHSYPFIQGGDNEDDNLVLACASCNLEKHAMSTLEFLRTKSSITAISDDRKADEPEACGRRTPSREVEGVTEA